MESKLFKKRQGITRDGVHVRVIPLLDPGADFIFLVPFCERLFDRPIGYVEVCVRVLRLSDQCSAEKLIVIVVKRYERSWMWHS